MKTKGKRVTKGRGPGTVNGKVPPRRLPNADRRPREYLTPEEVDRLMTAARKRVGARNPHRDATMILLAYRHGLRASEFCSLRWDMLRSGSSVMLRRRPRHLVEQPVAPGADLRDVAARLGIDQPVALAILRDEVERLN